MCNIIFYRNKSEKVQKNLIQEKKKKMKKPVITLK